MQINYGFLGLVLMGLLAGCVDRAVLAPLPTEAVVQRILSLIHI